MRYETETKAIVDELTKLTAELNMALFEAPVTGNTDRLTRITAFIAAISETAGMHFAGWHGSPRDEMESPQLWVDLFEDDDFMREIHNEFQTAIRAGRHAMRDAYLAQQIPRKHYPSQEDDQ